MRTNYSNQFVAAKVSAVISTLKGTELRVAKFAHVTGVPRVEETAELMSSLLKEALSHYGFSPFVLLVRGPYPNAQWTAIVRDSHNNIYSECQEPEYLAKTYGLGLAQLLEAAEPVVPGSPVLHSGIKFIEGIVRLSGRHQMTGAQAQALWLECRVHLVARGLVAIVNACEAAEDADLDRDAQADIRDSLALILTKHPWPLYMDGEAKRKRFSDAVDAELKRRNYERLLP